MKIYTLIVLTLTVITFANLCEAGEAKNNFFMLRYEQGKNNASEKNFSELYVIYENNYLEKWALATKIVSGENNFKLIEPQVFFKIHPSLHIGAKYSSASVGNDLVGLSIRYKSVLWKKVFTIIDATEYFDSEGDSEKTDIWFHVSQAKKQGWRWGAEAWYFNFHNGTENLKLRPIKVSYKFSNGLAPFLMLQRHWNNRGLQTDSIMGGIELSF